MGLAQAGPRGSLPDVIDALRAALAAEQLARREAETRASGAEAMVAHLERIHPARAALCACRGSRGWPLRLV